MIVQDVITAVSNDIRQVLSASPPDSAIYIPWVDRIQKDALHTSLFNALLQAVETISVTANTSSYTLGTAVRRLLLVYDRTFDRVLTPIDDLAGPTTKRDATDGTPIQMPKALLTASTNDQWPEYYRRIGSTGLYLFPAPQKTAFAGTYEIHYEASAPDLVNTTDTMLIPSDGKDLMVAGVNMMASQYLKMAPETQFWQAQYEQMKKGIASA